MIRESREQRAGRASRVESRPTNLQSRNSRGVIAGLTLYVALAGDLPAAEFTFGALGDTPYTRFEEAYFPELAAEMNREELAFVVHVGDFKSGRAPCSDELFRQGRNLDGGRITFPYKPVRRNDARVLAME